MEVVQSRSAWPFMAMLLVLLLCCISVPLFWHSDGSTAPVPAAGRVEQRWIPAPAAADQSASSQDSLAWLRMFGSPAGVPDEAWGKQPYQLRAPDTIDDLIAAQRQWSYLNDTCPWAVVRAPLLRDDYGLEVRGNRLTALAGEHLARACSRLGRAVAKLPEATGGVRDACAHWMASRNEAVFSVAPLPPQGPAFTWRVVEQESGERSLVRPQQAQRPAPSQRHSDPWLVPHVLMQQLEQLTHHPLSSAWADETLTQLRALTERPRMEGEDVQARLAALTLAAQQAAEMAETCHDDRLRVALLRAHWGLARRLDAWAAVHEIRVAAAQRQRLASRASTGLVFQEPVGSAGLHRDPSTLAARLEEYERTREPRIARQVARERIVWEQNSEVLDQAISESIEQHYRNANVRLALTGEFLNRFVDERRKEVRPVRDRIVGTPVRGVSETESHSRLELEPASGRWQMYAVADGVVRSNSIADGGRARLRSYGSTEFTARKAVVVDPYGVQLEQADVQATHESRLVGVTTDVDWVPLVNSCARERALREYHARRSRARAEVEYKVSSQAADQLDRETLVAVRQIEQQVRENVTGRLANADVEFTTVELETTPERIVGRFRVAGQHQLGSHTPRPRALSDSLASLQIHETALTNAAAGLQLENGRFTARELQAHFREKCPRLVLRRSDARDDVEFHFAPEDAIVFHIDNGRLDLALRFTSIEIEDHVIRNFTVHAFYVPQVHGLEVSLAREGALGIEGRVSGGDRARLHNVFNTVFAADRTLPIVRLDDPNDPRFAGLTVTQFVLEDGWLGLAVGPGGTERVAERSRSLR